jgi:hypothetical protein
MQNDQNIPKYVTGIYFCTKRPMKWIDDQMNFAGCPDYSFTPAFEKGNDL